MNSSGRQILIIAGLVGLLHMSWAPGADAGQCLGGNGRFLEGTRCEEDDDCNLEVCVDDDGRALTLCPSGTCSITYCEGGFCDGQEVKECHASFECAVPEHKPQALCYAGRCYDRDTGQYANIPCPNSAEVSICSTCSGYGGSSNWECRVKESETLQLDTCESQALLCGPAADLELTLDCGRGRRILCSGESWCEVKVRHLGGVPEGQSADDVTIQLELPAGLENHCNDCSADLDGNVYSWEAGSLAVGDQTSCVFAFDTLIAFEGLATASITNSSVLDQQKLNNTDQAMVEGRVDFRVPDYALPVVSSVLSSSNGDEGEAAVGLRFGLGISARSALELGTSYLRLDNPSDSESMTVDLDLVFHGDPTADVTWLIYGGPGWRLASSELAPADGFVPHLGAGLVWNARDLWSLDIRVAGRHLRDGEGWVSEAQAGVRFRFDRRRGQ